VPDDPQALALRPAGRALYVLSGGALTAVRRETGTVSWSVAIGGEQAALVAAPGGRTVYVASDTSRTKPGS
jgi:hypothetical protein